MTLEVKKNKSLTKSYVDNEKKHIQKSLLWPQILGAMIAGVAAAMQGSIYVFPTRAMPLLISEEDPDLRLSKTQASWFAAMQMVAGLVICPSGGILSGYLGRKRCFLLFCTSAIVGFVMIALASNIATLFIGRFITIIACLGVAPSVGTYICETVHPNYRSSLLVFPSIFMTFGMVIVLGIGYCAKNWRHLAWICIFPPIICIFSITFLFDTPYWLIEKGRNEEAKKSLQFFRGKDYDVSGEYDEIFQQCASKKELTSKHGGVINTLKRLASGAFWRPFMSIGVIGVILQMGEYCNLMLYMISIFEQTNSSIEPQLAPVIAGSIQLCAASISGYMMGKFSPKYVYIGCMGTTVIFDVCLATFSYFQSKPEYGDILESIGWLPLVFVSIIIMMNSLGCMPGFHIFIAEVYPSDIRTLSIGLTYAALMGVAAVNTVMFPDLIRWFNFYGTFYGYAFFTAVACSWAIYILPDNRGLTLVQIEENFAAKSKSSSNFKEGADIQA